VQQGNKDAEAEFKENRKIKQQLNADKKLIKEENAKALKADKRRKK
jgi:hypothetical protein